MVDKRIAANEMSNIFLKIKIEIYEYTRVIINIKMTVKLSLSLNQLITNCFLFFLSFISFGFFN
jgi:hypothetical protein